MTHKMRWMFLLFGVALTLSACGDAKVQGNFGKNKNNTSKGDLVLPDNAVEFEPGAYVVPGIHMRPGIEVHEIGAELEADLKLDEEAFTAELKGAAAAEVSDIKVGDILMTNEIIARVGEVSNVNGVITLALEDFVLWDVIHGEWSLQIELDRDEDDLYPVSPDDYEVRRQLLSQRFSLDGSVTRGSMKYSVGASATASINPSFTFEGKIPFYESSSNYKCANPQVDVRVLFKQFTYCIDYLKLAVVASNEFKNTASLKSSASAKAEWPDKNNVRAFKRALGEIPVAGPFSFKPSLYIDRQYKASVEASVTLDFTSSSGASVPVGFEYRNGSGYSMLPNSGNPPTKHSSLSGSITAEGSAEASAYAELGLAMAVCTTGSSIAGACFEGLSAGARVTAKATYKDSISTDGPHKSACLSLSADLSVALTGKVKAEVTAAGGTFEKSVLLFSATFTPVSINIAKWDDGGKYCVSGLSHNAHVKSLNETYDVDVDCNDKSENPLIGTCAEKFMVHCFDPDGVCKGTAYEDGSYDMKWESGDQYHSTIDEYEELGPGMKLPKKLLGDFIGADGEQCAEQKTTVSLMSGGADGCTVSAIIELLISDDEGEEEDEEAEEGEEKEYRFKKGDKLTTCVMKSGDIRYTCPAIEGEEIETFTVAKDDAGKICLQGPCKFEKGYLEDRDENRGVEGKTP